MSYYQSWKEKVDPAFDQLIKFYIQFIDLVGLPSSKGWIGLDDEALKLWEKKGMKGWIKDYEKEMTAEKNTIIKWKIPKHMSEKERKKKMRDFEKRLDDQLKILPEDSQAYYKKTFEPFYSIETAKNHFKQKSLGELKEIYTNYITDQYLLSLHVAVVEMQNESLTSTQEALAKKYFRASLIIEIIVAIYNSIALLVFEKTLTDLIKEARDGETESFFNLLQIDRTVIECEWAQKMIRKAQLAADINFFERMAKEISRTPLENDKEYTTARVVILLFWQLGLRKLDYDEMIELLESCGIILQEYSDTFQRFVRRLTQNTRRREIITFNKRSNTTK